MKKMHRNYKPIKKKKKVEIYTHTCIYKIKAKELKNKKWKNKKYLKTQEN